MWYQYGKDSQLLICEYQSRQSKTKSGNFEHVICNVYPTVVLEHWAGGVATDSSAGSYLIMQRIILLKNFLKC